MSKITASNDYNLSDGILMPKLTHHFRVQFFNDENNIIPGTEYISNNLIKIEPFDWANLFIIFHVQDDVLGRAMDSVHDLYDNRDKKMGVVITHLDGSGKPVEQIKFLNASVTTIIRDGWSYSHRDIKLTHCLSFNSLILERDDTPQWVKDMKICEINTYENSEQTMVHKIHCSFDEIIRVKSIDLLE